MATSSNGLKFMWVPGRKRHDRKGQYNTTKNYHNPYKNSNQGGHQQRKNEAWSLGGTRGQRSIINTDAHEILGESAGAASAANLVGEAALKVSGTAILGTASTSTQAKLEDDSDKKLELIKENVEAANECNKESDSKTNYHNASTLVLGERRKKSNGSDQDLDSIEQLSESKVDLNESTDGDIDVTDTASTQNLQTKSKRRRNKNRKRSKAKKDEETRPEDDKLVACLYYSLVCCDCTIS